jgi:hypothetical protein
MASNPKDPKAETAAATGAPSADPQIENGNGDGNGDKGVWEKDELKELEIKQKDWKEKEKELVKDQKDINDAKVHKEHKDIKEAKDKEYKEHKDYKDPKDHKLEFKEHKPELKDQQKDLDKQNLPLGPVNPGDPATRPDIEQRLAALEGKVATFIRDSSRPDLRAGALKNEPDQSGGGQGSGG